MAKGAMQNGTASGLSEVGIMQGSQVSCFMVPQEKDNVTLEVSLDDMVRTLSIPDYDQDDNPVNMLEGGKCLTVQTETSSYSLYFAYFNALGLMTPCRHWGKCRNAWIRTC